MRKITRQLLDKSVESFLLGLELINKPTIGYRAESFAILHINAWELLMKAYLFESSKGRKFSIFKRKRSRQRRDTISLDESLVKVFTNENDPVKRNIEYIADIRNSAIHLLVAELDPLFSRAFQSGVFNYLNCLFQWFGLTLEKKLKPGLLGLITNEKMPSIRMLKTKYNKEDFETVSILIKSFEDLEKLGLEGAISIEYTVAIVRNPKKADFIISSGFRGVNTALILEKSKDVDLTHPLNSSSAVKEILKRIPAKTKFTPHDFQAFCFVRRIKRTDKNEYFWKSKYQGSGQYSSKVVDEIVESVKANPKILGKWRFQYRQYLNDRRKKRKSLRGSV